MQDINRESVWLQVLRRYLVFVLIANLSWEFAHFPLYTLWDKGTTSEIIFAALHCTGGDIMIAMASLVIALLFIGDNWPLKFTKYWYVAILVISLGLGYTLFSEWLNIVVRKSWEYSELMPIIPILDVGLSPFTQWIIIPALGFWYARRLVQYV